MDDPNANRQFLTDSHKMFVKIFSKIRSIILIRYFLHFNTMSIIVHSRKTIFFYLHIVTILLITENKIVTF